MKPFMKYPGGKSKEIPIIVDHLPHKISRYFEPFVGGGSVFLDFEIHPSFINDKSQDLYFLYKFIKENNQLFFEYLNAINSLWHQSENNDFSLASKIGINDSLLNKNKKTMTSRKLKTLEKFENNGIKISRKDKKAMLETAIKSSIYMCIRDIYNRKECQIELHVASYYFMREYSYSSMFRFSKNGDFNVPYGGVSYNHKYMDDKISMMKSDKIKDLLKDTVIENDDFESFLKRFNFTEDDFIFLDPPYDSDFSTYDKNSFDKDEQIRLKNFLQNCKAKWMLVIKKTDFITDLYKDFNHIEYDKKYLVSFKNRNSRKVEHLLITNY